MKRPTPTADIDIPAELSMPFVPPKEVTDWRQLEQGQLVELRDGQHGVVLSVERTAEPTAEPAAAEAVVLRLLRVAWPRENPLPLGQALELAAAAAGESGPFLVH